MLLKMRFIPKRSALDEEPTINLTPLIDVVFVILIMFIVIAPLLEIEKIELPKSSPIKETVNVKKQSIITIEVTSDNHIKLNKTTISFPQLLERLKTLKHSFPKETPQLFHDKRATFGTYQDIKTALEMAGFEEVDLILKPN